MTTTQSSTEQGKLPPGYTIQPGTPSVPEYRNLRKSAGLSPVTEAQGACVASGSWYGCHITYHGLDAQGSGQPQVVAMGRIIGDGGWYFHIADMATLPEHQRKGLGGIILKHLLGHIKDNSPEDGKPYISLFADPPGRRLYEKHGFVAGERFDELGMVMVMEK
ncbi:hypothetical protein VP1G_03541 [Cytospora mali]|uniref:N-acetyltransferase domain-containing protein n=1 Tax=Cytospora mali TaxID=578113 RepID=A0A194UWN2_CYTMA|nr:hypothetical protein VP1G_03541 [Valsa mali var. pyri (nom. inval.)]